MIKPVVMDSDVNMDEAVHRAGFAAKKATAAEEDAVTTQALANSQQHRADTEPLIIAMADTSQPWSSNPFDAIIDMSNADAARCPQIKTARHLNRTPAKWWQLRG